MKALLLTQEFPPRISGGIAAYYYHLCRELAGEIAVLTPGDGEDEAFDNAQSFAIHRVTMPVQPTSFMQASRWAFLRLPYIAFIALAQYLLFAYHSWQRLRQDQAGLLLVGHLYLAPMGRLLAVLLKRRYTVLLHGGELNRYWHLKPVRVLMRWGMDGADFLIVNSRHTQNQVRQRAVRADMPIHIIHPGVDTTRFTPRPSIEGGPTSPLESRGIKAGPTSPLESGGIEGVPTSPLESRGIEGGPTSPLELGGIEGGPHRGPILLSVARLVEWKGQDVVLQALPRIREAFPTVYYVIVGKGPYQEALQELSQRLGVEEAVIFAGFVPDEQLPLYYAAADVVVLPSREIRPGVPVEGFGITLMEAAASGKPVVAGNVGGTDDAVVDGVTGLLVDPNDVEAVADAILALLNDPAKAAQMGAAGRERAVADFTWAMQAERFLWLEKK